jgi:hypothetical protein
LNKSVDFYTPVVAQEYISIVTGIINDLGLK